MSSTSALDLSASVDGLGEAHRRPPRRSGGGGPHHRRHRTGLGRTAGGPPPRRVRGAAQAIGYRFRDRSLERDDAHLARERGRQSGGAGKNRWVPRRCAARLVIADMLPTGFSAFDEGESRRPRCSPEPTIPRPACRRASVTTPLLGRGEEDRRAPQAGPQLCGFRRCSPRSASMMAPEHARRSSKRARGLIGTSRSGVSKQDYKSTSRLFLQSSASCQAAGGGWSARGAPITASCRD
jgi:hypothetical protein